MNLDCTASILHFIHTALVHPYCTSVLHGTSCTFVLSWIILHNYCNRKTPPMHCANTITVFHCTAFHPYCTCFTSVLHVYCNRTTPPMHCANAVFHCTAFHPRTALVKHLYYMERTLTGTALVRHPRCTCASLCYTLCATPCTLHPAPCTLHPAPSLHTPVLHPRATPSVLHPAPCTLHPAPCTLHPRYTHLCYTLVLHPLCYTLHPAPCTFATHTCASLCYTPCATPSCYAHLCCNPAAAAAAAAEPPPEAKRVLQPPKPHLHCARVRPRLTTRQKTQGCGKAGRRGTERATTVTLREVYPLRPGALHSLGGKGATPVAFNLWMWQT